MKTLEQKDLMNLFEYEKERPKLRAEIMALKDRRRLHVSDTLTLLFENRRTVWYQIQEMMRAERMVEDDVIQEELDTYGPLVPSGGEWKATLYIEIPDLDVLKKTLPKLVDVEQSFYARVGGCRIDAVGEEGRSREDYTSTVHYLTFALTPEFREKLAGDEPLVFGVDHPNEKSEVEAPPSLRDELGADLDAI